MSKEDYKYNQSSDIDSDNDGLSDYEEVNVYGTDPYNPDTDDDGMNDGDEVKAGRNPKGPGNLRDLFVPHEGNDYKPHALHPKRLAFHGLSVLALKAVVVIFVLIFPIEAWLTPDIQLQESRKIIQLTNQIRSNLGLDLLTENLKLTQAAFQKAEDMLVNQYFAHVGPDHASLATWLTRVNYNYATAGENLAMGFANSQEVVNGWTRSKTHYANMIDPDFSEIGVGMASGMYKENDTTFVAQYFGTPNVFTAVAKEEPKVLEIEKEPQKEVEEDLSLENSRLKAEEEEKNPKESKEEIEPAVLNAQEKTMETVEKEKPLSPPVLVYPEDTYISKDNQVKLTVHIPEGDKINIYSDGSLLATKEVKSEYEDIFIELKEGKHKVRVQSVLADKVAYSGFSSITIDNTGPKIDYSKTKVTVMQLQGQDDMIVHAEAYLSADTKEAELNFGNYFINLTQDPGDLNRWFGKTTIFSQKEKQVFNPVVLATLSAKDFLGNESVSDVNWENIVPVKASLLNQYLFVRSNPSKYLKPIFSLSSWYFKILLIILSITLISNIFIEIKKQHPHIIASAVGLIGLLLILIIL